MGTAGESLTMSPSTMWALHDLPNQAHASRGARSPQNLSRRPACKRRWAASPGLKEAPDEITPLQKELRCLAQEQAEAVEAAGCVLRCLTYIKRLIAERRQ